KSRTSAAEPIRIRTRRRFKESGSAAGFSLGTEPAVRSREKRSGTGSVYGPEGFVSVSHRPVVCSTENCRLRPVSRYNSMLVRAPGSRQDQPVHPQSINSRFSWVGTGLGKPEERPTRIAIGCGITATGTFTDEVRA